MLTKRSIVAALFLLAGCAAKGPSLASRVEDLVGTWKSTTSTLEIEFIEMGLRVSI